MLGWYSPSFHSCEKFPAFSKFVLFGENNSIPLKYYLSPPLDVGLGVENTVPSSKLFQDKDDPEFSNLNKKNSEEYKKYS